MSRQRRGIRPVKPLAILLAMIMIAGLFMPMTALAAPVSPSGARDAATWPQLTSLTVNSDPAKAVLRKMSGTGTLAVTGATYENYASWVDGGYDPNGGGGYEDSRQDHHVYRRGT